MFHPSVVPTTCPHRCSPLEVAVRILIEFICQSALLHRSLFLVPRSSVIRTVLVATSSIHSVLLSPKAFTAKIIMSTLSSPQDACRRQALCPHLRAMAVAADEPWTAMLHDITRERCLADPFLQRRLTAEASSPFVCMKMSVWRSRSLSPTKEALSFTVCGNRAQFRMHD